jgi:hypothetical protein
MPLEKDLNKKKFYYNILKIQKNLFKIILIKCKVCFNQT